MEKLTTRDAWLELARAWASPSTWNSPNGFLWAVVTISGTMCFGLCESNYALEAAEKIDRHTANEIRRMIRKYKFSSAWRSRESYIWPTTARGAKARSLFCKIMAEKYERESDKFQQT